MSKGILILAVLVVLPGTAMADDDCTWSWCDRQETNSEPSRTYVTDQYRRKVGDVYDPGSGKRVQIRDNHRRIIGYIDGDGTVTNTSRQPVGAIEEMAD